MWKKIPVFAKNCKHCGSKFKKPLKFLANDNSNNKLKCHSCGTIVKEEYAYCPECGLKIRKGIYHSWEINGLQCSRRRNWPKRACNFLVIWA